MRKIKVLHISPDSVIHGTERHILAILKHIDRKEFDNCVAMPQDGDLNEILKGMNIKTYLAGRKHGYRSKLDGIFGEGSRTLYKLIREEKFDIVHTHLNSYGGIIAKLAGAPAVVHTRHGVFWSEEELGSISHSGRYFQKLKSKIFDRTVAIGEYEKKTLTEKFNYDEKKITITINGVDVDEINSKPDRQKTKTELFGTGDIIAGLVGRLERQKGFDYLLDAVDSIRNRIRGIKFVVLGDGSLRDELIERTVRLGLEKDILFTGYKKNILDYVNNFDFMIQTSLWEGLSYAVQEAMALGKPVIALTSPNVSGVKEIIADGQTGYLIESDFVNGLAKHILILSNDAEKRSQFGKAAMKREKEFFPEWKTARDMENMYRELLINKSGTERK